MYILISLLLVYALLLIYFNVINKEKHESLNKAYVKVNDEIEILEVNEETKG